MFDREYLVSVFQDTQERIKRSPDYMYSLEQSINAQTFIAENDNLVIPDPAYESDAKVSVTGNRTFEAAAKYRGQKVCVLNFASSSNPGGGVTNGARAQEESLCRCSTLYNCLSTRQMWDKFYAPHRRAHNPLHTDDIIFTPDVLVIKDDDYNLLEYPFTVDVITCAAPNLRYEPSNAYNSGEGYQTAMITPKALLELHMQRAKRIMDVAAQNHAKVLILGAFGCGAFRNDPNIVATAYKEVINDYLRHFLTIEFAVYCHPNYDNNYRTFKSVIGR